MPTMGAVSLKMASVKPLLVVNVFSKFSTGTTVTTCAPVPNPTQKPDWDRDAVPTLEPFFFLFFFFQIHFPIHNVKTIAL